MWFPLIEYCFAMGTPSDSLHTVQTWWQPTPAVAATPHEFLALVNGRKWSWVWNAVRRNEAILAAVAEQNPPRPIVLLGPSVDVRPV